MPYFTDAPVGLWAFSTALYREPGIEAFCLQLQDKQQVNVLVLLWCAWLEAHDLRLSPIEFACAAQTIRYKSDEFVVPLRHLRRGLKEHQHLPEEVRQEARGHLLKAELVLEKQLLQELEAQAVATNADRAKEAQPLSLLIEVEALEVTDDALSWFRRTAKETVRRLQP